MNAQAEMQVDEPSAFQRAREAFTAAEERLERAHQAREAARASLEQHRAHLAELQVAKQALVNQLAAGQAAPLAKVEADTAKATAAEASASETLAMLETAVEGAEEALFDAEQKAEHALHAEWGNHSTAQRDEVLKVVGAALRAWWKAEYNAGLESAPMWWVRSPVVQAAITNALEQAPDAPVDLPDRPPRSALLTTSQRRTLRGW